VASCSRGYTLHINRVLKTKLGHYPMLEKYVLLKGTDLSVP
jgi:hypothetical protein